MYFCLEPRTSDSRLENPRRVPLSVLVMLSLMSSSFTLLQFVPTASAQTPTVPSGIGTHVPTTITNPQSSPTPTPFQQMVQIDSTTHSTYEASNLHNVELFDSTGTLIPSWLESGASIRSTDTSGATAQS